MDSQPVDGTFTDVWVSITEIAERKGVSKQAISTRVKKLAADGLISTPRRDGKELKVNLVEFDRAIGANTDPAQMLRNPSGIAMPSPTSEDGKQPLPKSPGYMGHKEVIAGYQAENERLDLEERLERLCDKADVEARTFGVFRRLRDRALSYPATVAPRIAHLNDERSIRMILEEEMRKLLDALSKDLDAVDNEEADEEPADGPATIQ